MEVELDLPPQYLPYLSNNKFQYQEELESLLLKPGPIRIIICNAPTGAGKTWSIINLVKDLEKDLFGPGAIIISPTNALASQIQMDLKSKGVGNISKWTAKGLLGQGKGYKRHEGIGYTTLSSSVIIGNPDIFHLFTQHEYAGYSKYNFRPYADAMKNIKYLVFDEYHTYDSRMMASILTYILKAQQEGLDHVYIFLSATPDDHFIQTLKKCGLDHHDPIQASPTIRGNDRKIKGALKCRITNSSIFDSLPSKDTKERCLYIFNSLVQEENFYRKLIKSGFDKEKIVQITGLDTRSNIGQQDYSDGTGAVVLLATSKADVGLNIAGLDKLVMEPGWSTQQFWQRFGRAGRGKDARIVLHFEGYPETFIKSIKGPDYETLQSQIRGGLKSRHINVNATLRFIGYYLAVYSEHSKGSIPWENLPDTSKRAFKQLKELIGGEHDSLLPEESKSWSDALMRSFAALRGKEIPVKTSFEWRGENFATESDLLWILSKTEHLCLKDEGRYHVTDFLERIEDCNVSYEFMRDEEPLIVTAKKGRLPDDLWLRLATEIREFLDIEEGEVPLWWEKLASFLENSKLPLNQIMPVEVLRDDIFI